MATRHPLVSIVVPTFRRVTYLEQAIASVVAQTFEDFEVIVSDDADDAATKRITESFGDGRVRYRSNGRNLGMCENNRAAFGEARGKLVANLHDDDRWHPTFLHRLVTAIEDPAVNLAFCDHNLMDAQGTVDVAASLANSVRWGRADLPPGPSRPFYSLVVRQAIPAVMGTVFRAACVDWQDLPREAGPAYDIWLSYLAARGGGAAVYVDERLVDYRVHAASQTGTGGVSWRTGAAQLWQRVAEDPAYAEWHHAARGMAAKQLADAASASLHVGRRADVVRYAARSLRMAWNRRACGIGCAAILPAAVSRAARRRLGGGG